MTDTSRESQAAAAASGRDGEFGLLDLALVLVARLKLLIVLPLLVGALAFGTSYLINPTFTATTTFLPPQQQQSATSSALASLGALAGLAGVGGGIKSPADQYVALMQSVTVQDRLVDQYKLMQVYEAKYRFEARRRLAQNVRIELGKKDGLVTVEVDDHDPQRAADLANGHVEELHRMTNVLAVSEAQQRRVFFEKELERAKGRLTAAQQALQASGFTQGALQSEPKAAAERYARLRAEATALEVRLQTMRSYLSESAPEYRQQQAALAALREQIGRAEQTTAAPSGGNAPDYISKYRDFKYEETLFELFARQYESARLDESREGALIQVVDRATKPEWKSKPKRASIAMVAGLASFVLLVIALLVRHLWQLSVLADGAKADKLRRMRLSIKQP